MNVVYEKQRGSGGRHQRATVHHMSVGKINRHDFVHPLGDCPMSHDTEGLEPSDQQGCWRRHVFYHLCRKLTAMTVARQSRRLRTQKTFLRNEQSQDKQVQHEFQPQKIAAPRKSLGAAHGTLRAQILTATPTPTHTHTHTHIYTLRGSQLLEYHF